MPQPLTMFSRRGLLIGVPEESGQHFGFGGSVDPATGEYGWSGAAGTLAFADPTSRTAVAVMIQELGRTISTDAETRAALRADA